MSAMAASEQGGSLLANNPYSPPRYEHLGLHRYRQLDTGTPRDKDQVPASMSSASALEGLTVQQLLDVDVESMAITIDRQQQLAKKAILDHFMETKARMLAAKNAAVEEEARTAGLKLAAKQAEVDLLQFELHQATSRAHHLSDTGLNLAAALDATKHAKRCLGLVLQTFYAWRQRTLMHRQRALRLQRGLHWYHVERLQRHVLQGWYKEAMRLRKVSVQTQAQQQAQAQQQQLQLQHGLQLEQFRQQLSEAHAALQQEREQREKLEESMKQAFMRGVCALNIEAMSIFKRGAPPAGVNPFPGTVPGAAGQEGGAGTAAGQAVPMPAQAQPTQPSTAAVQPAAGGAAAQRTRSPSPHFTAAAGPAGPAGSAGALGTAGGLGGARARVVVERGPGAAAAASPAAAAAVAAATAAAATDAAPQPRPPSLVPGPTARDRAYPLGRPPA